jgi:hypothetical protein
MDNIIHRRLVCSLSILYILLFKVLALDRLVGRGSSAVHRLAPKQSQSQTEITDETINNRQLKKTESNEYLTGNDSLLIKNLVLHRYLF